MRTLKLFSAVLAASILAVVGFKATPSRATVENVAVIVIDNFGLRPMLLPKKPPLGTNCAYVPEDTNVVGDDGAGDDLPATVPHGIAVQSRLSEELDGAPGLLRLPNTTDLTPYGLAGIGGIASEAQRWAKGAQEVMLIGMDTNGYTTAQLAARITTVTEALRRSPRAITRVVLNMSFVIVPCNVPAWLATIGAFDGVRTLAAYHALLGEHPELDDLRDDLDTFPADPAARDARLLDPAADDPLIPLRLLAAPGEFYGLLDPAVQPPSYPVGQYLHSDPLRFTVSTLTQAGPVVPVAAAGNGLRVYMPDGKLDRVRFSFPFAPALWDAVVSVSGGVDRQTRAGYSNNGEVVLEGTTKVRRNDNTVAEVHGSSFAAPRLSASMAVHLLAGGASPCEGHVPALGYTNSELPGQQWEDLPLLAAVKRYCTAYRGYAP